MEKLPINNKEGNILKSREQIGDMNLETKAERVNKVKCSKK